MGTWALWPEQPNRRSFRPGKLSPVTFCRAGKGTGSSPIELHGVGLYLSRKWVPSATIILELGKTRDDDLFRTLHHYITVYNLIDTIRIKYG